METKKTIQSLFCDFLSTAESELNEGDYLTVSNALKNTLDKLKTAKPIPEDVAIPCDAIITFIGKTTLQLHIPKIIIKRFKNENHPDGYYNRLYYTYKVVSKNKGPQYESAEDTMRYNLYGIYEKMKSLYLTTMAKEFTISHRFLPTTHYTKDELEDVKPPLDEDDDGEFEHTQLIKRLAEIVHEFYANSANLYDTE